MDPSRDSLEAWSIVKSCGTNSIHYEPLTNYDYLKSSRHKSALRKRSNSDNSNLVCGGSIFYDYNVDNEPSCTGHTSCNDTHLTRNAFQMKQKSEPPRDRTDEISWTRSALYNTSSKLYHTKKMDILHSQDDDIVLDQRELKVANEYDTPGLHELSQRRDFSLPLDLDYDILESQTEIRHMMTHSSTRSSYMPPRSVPLSHRLLTRFRRGSGSLNDISVDESTKKSNLFDFGNDLDLSEQGEKMKTKLMSVWNNMKYGWTIKTKTFFKYDSQIYLLGRLYHIKREEEEPEYAVTRNPLQLTSMEQFKRDFTSRLWFTYRRDMPPLPMSNLTTDCGWGCMLRCGQMIIAQGLIDHFMGRDWRVYDYQLKEEITYHHQIIRWFGDYPSHKCPFSIHSLIVCGQFTGKKSGNWYGPSSIAHILKYALQAGYENQPILKNVAIYVAQDCTVYLTDIANLASQDLQTSCSLSSSTNSWRGDTEWRRGVIILIPVRLGGECLNAVYIPCIKAVLAQGNCIGIIGGKPRHSMYFIGWQEDKLIYLDPHYCQDIVDVRQRDFRFESYHCMSPRKISINKIDPSCTIGFYCRSNVELQQFINHTQEMMSGPQMRGLYPMFVISDGASKNIPSDSLMMRQSQHSTRSTNVMSESDEFVFI